MVFEMPHQAVGDNSNDAVTSRQAGKPISPVLLTIVSEQLPPSSSSMASSIIPPRSMLPYTLGALKNSKIQDQAYVGPESSTLRQSAFASTNQPSRLHRSAYRLGTVFSAPPFEQDH